MPLEVICIEEEAFYVLLEKAVERLSKNNPPKKDKWISGEDAMKILHITSTTTLQTLRDTGKIRYSQPMKKVILYDVDSIYAYLEDNSYETF
ncbi:DNA-binding protein [Pedobacter sp. KACC 23697]|uniref:DNA-binding protein n=1 Tax=Pedobacter sp. KACC 23697 TaxID=3149230 RepID=A0AAU7K5T3_9SPHI